MVIQVRPATVFEDVAAVVGPKNPASNVCFCLSYRIGSRENQALRGPARAERVRELCAQDPSPGVLAYDGDTPVGWAALHGEERVDLTMAYVGTRRVFERAGFTWAADTSSVLAGFPRVIMRLDLRGPGEGR